MTIMFCLLISFFAEALVICITDGETMLAPDAGSEIEDSESIGRSIFPDAAHHIFFRLMYRDAWVYGLAGLLGGLLAALKNADRTKD